MKPIGIRAWQAEQLEVQGVKEEDQAQGETISPFDPRCRRFLHAGAYPFGMQCPPWPGVEGPSCYSGYEKAIERWKFSIYGGGLWDFACDPHAAPMGTAPRVEAVQSTPPMVRFDLDLLRRYAEEASLPHNQHDAYLKVVVEGLSIKRAARELGVDRNNLRQDLRRLERKARRWATHTGSAVG